LFATIPTAKAVGPTTDEWQKGGKWASGKWKVELGPLAFLHIAHTQRCRWSKVCTTPFALLKTTKK